jgi:hypothetical protein
MVRSARRKRLWSPPRAASYNPIMRTRAQLASAAAIVLVAATASAASLPFLQDDFTRARAEATARKLPLFVEVWAPW